MHPQPMGENEDSIRIGSVLDGWEVESEIMRTDLSELWKVRNQFIHQPAALKVIAEELMQNQDMIERFRREIRLLTELRYEHVPPAIGHFPVGKRYAVVSKWIDGPTLAGIIEQHPGGMELTEIARIAVPILRTLHRMHAQTPQLIHRDIKPLNIMVEKTGKPYLIDFGIALVRGDARLSRTGMIVGSPHYMAPEMIQRQFEISYSVDIYAFGIVLFEMATGKKPFDASPDLAWFDFLGAIQNQHIHAMPPWVADLRPGLPDDFEFLVQKAIEKDPTKRWASCEEMADFLQSIAGPQPLPIEQPKPDPIDDPSKNVPKVIVPPPETPVVVGKWMQLILSPCAALVGSFPLIVTAIDGSPIESSQWFFAIGGAVISLAGYLRLMYYAWEGIQDDQTDVSAAQVLREHFFFPWTLVAIWRYFAGYANNYNQFLERNQYDLPYMSSAASNLFVLLPFLSFPIFLLPSGNREEQQIRLLCFLALFSMLLVIYSAMISRICDAINDVNDYRLMLQSTESEQEVGQP